MNSPVKHSKALCESKDKAAEAGKIESEGASFRLSRLSEDYEPSISSSTYFTMEELQQLNDDYAYQVHFLQSKLGNSQKKFENYLKTIGRLEGHIQKHMSRNVELEKTCKMLELKNQELKIEIGMLKTSLKEMGKKNTELGNNIKKKNNKIEDLNKKNQETESKFFDFCKKKEYYYVTPGRCDFCGFDEDFCQKLEIKLLSHEDPLQTHPILTYLASEFPGKPENEILEILKKIIQGTTDQESIERSPSKLTISTEFYPDSPQCLLETHKFSLVILNIAQFTELFQSVFSQIIEKTSDLSSKLLRILDAIHKQPISEKKSRIFSKLARCSLPSIAENIEKSKKNSKSQAKVENKLQELDQYKKLLLELDRLYLKIEEKNEKLLDLHEKLNEKTWECEKLAMDLHEAMLKCQSADTELERAKENLLETEEKAKSDIEAISIKAAKAQENLETQKLISKHEKNFLFEHIVLIENENIQHLSHYKYQISELKKNLRTFECTLEAIESELGAHFTGDYVESIRTLVAKSRRTFSLNPFRKSETKSNPFKVIEEENPTDSSSFTVVNLQKELANERSMNSLNLKQMESLKETIRHLEFEKDIDSDHALFRSLRTLIIELASQLPLLKSPLEGVLKKILALIWLSDEEKSIMQKRVN
ncbi:hypothetical protein SteCoe_10842 [Stentor coeruleus]|uniref:Uncharacterized protein n=1 Tax=Stentor coeruleus TaxID=5963 RepID=A0A1R2CEP0_9CILI|nr:hypothetical protein SteCoe_10842 [Stentor coeruleus]